MAKHDETGQTTHTVRVRRDPARISESALTRASWLLQHKVELPDPIEGYVQRREVQERCALTDRRLTVLHAPGGFGKTALLGHSCRALRERGIAVAWLSLDEEDGPESVATYLALAFERAGLETFDAAGAPGKGVEARIPEPEADSQTDYRMNLLVRALERHGAQCVLALDDVERLRRPEAVSAINALLCRAPRHLHVGMAFRERPPGLEIAMFALDGRGVTVTAAELQFSPQDTARFFETRLSRRELKSVIARSAGWPIALRIYRNAKRQPTPDVGGGGDDDTVAGWIETRLWRGVSAADLDFVLDIALFDSIDPELIDAVTGVRNSGRRIASMDSLAGLVSITGDSDSTMQLHPLIKDYCEKRRFREDPDRFRAIHRGIAHALARRNRVVDALRHAKEAGDLELLGRIAESTGGVRLGFEQGLQVLRTADGLLTAEMVSKFPRMALARCAVLTASGDIEGAKRLYAEVAAETADFTRDRKDGDDRALQIDHMFVQGLLHMCGCRPYGGGIMAAMAAAEGVANAPDTDSSLRGMSSLGKCIVYTQMTEFDSAVECADYARKALGRGAPYLAHVDLQVGLVAMARGRAREARNCYDRALRIARASHLRDTGAVMIGEVLAGELELERSTGGPRVERTRVSFRLLGECSAWLDVYTASIEVGAELALLRAGPQEALVLLEDAREYARHTDRAALLRFLSALRVSVLLAGGQVAEASNAWRLDRLPERAVECTDLKSQSWREAEMVSCSRLRLLLAGGEFDAARELAVALRAVAEKRCLVRTLMRGLALSMVLEHGAGARDRARVHLVDYLRLFSEADYAWPLARERMIALELLDDIVHVPGVDAAVVTEASRLREAMRDGARAGESPPPQALSKPEFDVLARLERHSDKEIAKTLNLSYDGVRYRVRRIFAKLRARGRIDAVHRARSQGILPPAEHVPGAES